jgi:uncharacterized damage-inducible protein DinB
MHTTISINEKALLEANIEVLGEGMGLLELLDAKQYCLGCKPAFQSTIGAHFRHILEHYSCFIEQFPSGEICYDRRYRNERLEKNRDLAIVTITDISDYLNELTNTYEDREYVVVDQVLKNDLQTSFTRELMFLHSHTVHHYAIVAAMARMHGLHPKADFGVAIATRVFAKDQASCANSSSLPSKKRV